MSGRADGFDFIEMVEEYIYMDDEISDRITEWARSHCSTFVDKDPRSVEQPLEHTQLHEEYCQLFESIIERFLHEKDMTVKEFYAALSDQYELAEARELDLPVNATFASTLMSFTDFFSFCELMYDVNTGGDAIFCPPLLEVSETDRTQGFGGSDSSSDCKGGYSQFGDCDVKSSTTECKDGDSKADSK
jgi:hypothetical protein